jgi:hypothetical protein
MKLAEVEHITRTKVTYSKSVDECWCASLALDFPEGGCLRSVCAFGATRRDAKVAIAQKLSGRTVVKNAHSSEPRQHFDLPVVKS